MKKSSLKDYKILLVTLISLLAITGIGFIDNALWNIIFAVVGVIAYFIVGLLYSTGLIDGKREGSEANAAVFIILIIIGILIYQGLRKFQQWLVSWPLALKIIVPSCIVLFIIFAIVMIIVINKKGNNNEQ